MKKHILFFILVSILSFYVAYSQKKMKVEIKETKNIPDFPSGSGIAQNNGKYYAIGDDSPFLYVIDKHFQLEEKIRLFPTENIEFKGNRIKKKQKPDFETLEMIAENELVIFGSGSKSPQRDVFVRVFLGKENSIEKHSISAFYEYLKTLPLLENSELNIEATAFADGFLYLFNRANNVVIRFNYQEFIAHLTGGELPKLESKRIVLPKIQSYEAGFSGAATLNSSKIIFTASAEATNDAYNDGEIIGSLVGEIDITDFQDSKVTRYGLIPNGKQRLKVESITLNPSKSTDKMEVVFITDDDNGNTELIRAILK